MSKKLLLLLSLCAIGFSVTGQNPWKKAKEKDGITVFTRQVEGSRIREFKGVCEVESGLSPLVAVLMDIPHLTDWVYESKNTELLKQIDETELYYYLEIKVPFPFENRDLVQQLKIKQDQGTGKIIATLTNHPDYIEPRKSLVRMKKAEGFWELTPLRDGKVKVLFQYLSDPGGNIPAWIVNPFIVQSPFKTLSAFRKKIHEAGYRDLKIDWLNEQQDDSIQN